MKKSIPWLLFSALLVSVHFGSAEEIHTAAQKGDLTAVKACVENNPDSVNAKDEDGRTPLHWSCRGDYLDLVAYLLDKGADVNALDNNRIAPLHSLAVRNLIAAAQLLIEKGADVNCQDYDKQTPLHHAAASGRVQVSTLLVEKGTNLEIKDNWGRTPLLLCARERGGPRLTRILVEAGADVNAKDKYGATSLNLAAWRGKREVVDVLLDAKAEIPSEGRAARTLLIYAASKGLDRLFDTLEAKGADITITLQSGGSLLHEAAGGGSLHIIRKLIQKRLDPQQKDQLGWPPLHYAARDGRVEAAAFLIERGVDKNARSIMGQSAYNVAEEFRQEEISKLLAASGASRDPLEFPTLEGAYLGQRPPGDTPEVFALGIVSSIWGLHSSVAFSPDGSTALWTPMVVRPGAIYSTGVIYMITRENNRWTAPRIAPFSGKFDDDVPFFAPDGKKLYFISNCPLPGNPRSGKERIWVMDKIPNGWSEPKPIDSAVNDRQLHWQFSVDPRGSIYFSTSSPEGFGRGDIYVSLLDRGAYTAPKNLGPAVNTEKEEATPFIAPDGSYLIFQRSLDLYISYSQEDGTWTAAQSLGAPINTPGNELCPLVSPDGKYLFFISTRGGKNQVFWVDAGFIERLRQ
jgi:ankyrin repeat protein